MASPHAGPTTHAGLATHGQAVAKAPYKGAAGCNQGQLAREADVAHRASNPQGRSMPIARAAACRGGAYGHGWLRPSHRGDTHKVDRLQGTGKGLPPAAYPTASRGSGVDRRGGCPLAGWLPAGKGSRRLRRGSSDGDDGVEGARGLGHHFEKRTILKIL
ncbi:hypothetical protein BHM03_00057789, partial [Ensete ventricosum]